MSLTEGYQLLQRIGSGVTGALYLAESGAGQVAIRQFECQAEPDSELWQRNRQAFLDGGRQALGLTHPCIVPVIEVIDEGAEAFVASEYVTGETLERAMTGRRFTAEEASPLLRDIAMALDFAHSRGIVHGDLKPSNIFLTNERAKIGDFAISPRAHVDRRQKIPPQFIHRYLSPEHFRTPQTVDGHSDQYSLAVLAYEMYTGQSPYGSAPDLSAAIPAGEISPPSSVNPQLPAALDEPLLRALDRDPARRFANCMEFVSFLGAGWITEADGRGGRRRAILLGGLAAVLVAALGAAYYQNRKPVPPAAAPVTQTGAATSPKEPAEEMAAKKPSPLEDVSAARSREKGQKSQERPLGPSPKANVAEELQVPLPPSRERGPTGGQGPALVERELAFQIDVFSRDHRLREGSSFAYGDQVLGELAHGDIRAIVTLGGQQAPRGRLTLEWTVDGVVMNKVPVTPGRLIEYGNEPTAGTYIVTLYNELHAVQKFTFRITP